MHIFLANGYKGIKAVNLQNSLAGTVLVETGTKFGNDPEYVVWHINRETDMNDFESYNGYYTTNWEDAVQNYESRTYRPNL